MNIENIALKLLVSIGLSLLIGRFVIPFMTRASIGQNVSEYGPESHLKKQGTPTMGGLIFALSLLVSILVFRVYSKEMIIVLISTFGFGLVGFIDDFIMLVKTKAEGLTPKQKIILQVILGFLLTILIKVLMPERFGIYRIPFLSKELSIPFISYILYPLVLVASVNAVNLTDGLDGLVSSVTLPVLAYLFLMSQAMEEVNTFSILLFGSLVGFLAYNSNKASIFMGDTGSMTIGGAVGILSIITGTSFYLPLFGIIYVIEAGSVIIQVISVKKRRGKKVFLMTPIHHSFEIKGYNEQKIVSNFTIVSLLACLVCLLI